VAAAPHSLPHTRRCCCEDSLSRELIKRLTAYPALRVHLDKLQPKVFALSSSAEHATPIEVHASELDVAADIERINKSKFTSKGDHPVVVGLYTKYVHNTVGALEKTLGSLQLESTEGMQVALPPMPVDTGFASMRAWHRDWMRAQHAYIPDALSGQQLNTLTECVPIGVEGHDADGKPLAVRDARSLCAWLHDLHSSSARTCALLTAGPAAGKTWLMSQIVMHALGQGGGRAEDDGREPLVHRRAQHRVVRRRARQLEVGVHPIVRPEYYAMLAIGKGGVPLPSFGWGVWWTNAVLMGVQAGGAAFGDAFVKVAQLPVVEAAAVPAGEAWRLSVFATLVRKGLPAAWLPTALEATRGVAREAALEAGKLAAADVLVVGKHVLALDVIWQQAVIARVEGDVVDVKIQGWKEKMGLPRNKALVVASDGAGALLRLAAGAGDAALVEALLDAGVNPLVADERANTPLHRAAAGGHVAICRALVAKGADEEEKNTKNQSAADVARIAKQHAVVRLFVPTLSDKEFTDEACTCTERLRAAATGDLATLARTQDAGRITALMVASLRKQLAAVAKLLESSNASTLNAQSAKGCSALYLAAEEGAEQIVQLLLTQGADAALADFFGGTPLMQASSFGHERCALVLLEAGGGAVVSAQNNAGVTALMLAAQNGHEQVARDLLKAGAAVGAQNNAGFTALMIAAQNGHEQVALILLKAGAAVDQTEEDGWTALMFAAQNGHEQVALDLLKAGAAVDQTEEDGWTALMFAAQNGHEQVTRNLLKSGAVVGVQNNAGVTALMLAASNGHEQVARILLEAGAAVDQTEEDGWTALFFAAQNGHEQVAIDLLKAGAVVSAQDNAGRTALMTAAQNGHEQVALVLLEAKADPRRDPMAGLP
jgi:ankyrin repeat protein